LSEKTSTANAPHLGNASISGASNVLKSFCVYKTSNLLTCQCIVSLFSEIALDMGAQTRESRAALWGLTSICSWQGGPKRRL